jgi:hypothetical protein
MPPCFTSDVPMSMTTSRVVLSLLFIQGCSGAGETRHPGPNTGSDATDSVPGTAVREPPFDSTSLVGLTCLTLMDAVFLAPLTRAELLQSYGAPDSLQSSTEPNRHIPGATDSLFEVHYSGLTARFRKPSEGSDLITEMHVSDNRYLRYPSIGIGARRDRLIQVVTDTFLVRDDRVEYDCGMGANEPITFWLVGGQIRRVSKTYYVD